MELYDLLSMDMGEVADWIEDYHSEYKLVPTEPEWEECNKGDLPSEDDQYYWVRNNLNGDIKLCYLITIGTPRWQTVEGNDDFYTEDTSWIMVDKPE